MNKSLSLLLLPLALFATQPRAGNPYAEPDMSPQEIQQQLDKAEADFAYAKTLFAPWYTGPLVTPSASMVAPGQALLQPYVYTIDNYASFNKDRKSISLPSNLVQLRTQPVVFQTGITDNVDTTISFAQVMNWQHSEFGGGIQDVSATIGFLIYPQGLYVPQFKFTITETFPTGKYKNLSTNGFGLNGTGGGVYSTQFALTTSKLLFWSTHHPVNSRLFIGYQVSTPTRVTNFNAYGGGFGTRGVVHPGNNLTVDLGLELSITQKWAVAADLVYTATNRNKFNGNPGVTALGAPAAVGSGYSDNLSIAPAFEYNWSENGGLVAGAWFSVYGRNSLNFVQGVVSAYFVFP